MIFSLKQRSSIKIVFNDLAGLEKASNFAYIFSHQKKNPKTKQVKIVIGFDVIFRTLGYSSSAWL